MEVKMIEWECPHCGNHSGTRAAEHDRFDWMVEDARSMKELWQCTECYLWQCTECYGYYFAYFKLEKITKCQEV